MDTTSLTHELTEWFDDGGFRHVRLCLNMRIMPYVRQTQTTRWRSAGGDRAREYNRVRGEVRDVVRLLMRGHRVEPFGKCRLGFSASFWLKPKQVFGGKRKAWRDKPDRLDLGNLEKAVEDILQDVLIPNDQWIWERGPGAKYEGEEDAFEVHVWELPESG